MAPWLINFNYKEHLETDEQSVEKKKVHEL